VLVVAKQFTAKHAVGSLKHLDSNQSTIGIEVQYKRGEGVWLVIDWPQRDRRVNTSARDSASEMYASPVSASWLTCGRVIGASAATSTRRPREPARPTSAHAAFAASTLMR
jgi:hypothetical protein